jgi:hypothetical protein
MCKGHQGGLGETTTIAHQEVAHDKDTCHKCQTHKKLPLMKVDKHNITCSNCMILMYN